MKALRIVEQELSSRQGLVTCAQNVSVGVLRCFGQSEISQELRTELLSEGKAQLVCVQSDNKDDCTITRLDGSSIAVYSHGRWKDGDH